MSILYKFRSGTTFEALTLPGTAAKLFDVKKAIVLAKKLDQGSIEFDLSIKDATTNEEYVDESMILPRGTRLVVQRLPAARGHGFLARMAQGAAGTAPTATSSAPANYYTINAQEEEEEFVSTEDKELEALRAATDATNASVVTSRIPSQQQRTAGQPPPPPSQRPRTARPNADPELREQEKQPKKRATGIPRTFQATLEAEGGGGTILQPNAAGFEELKNRAGGQSEMMAGTKRDLDYALKVTATSVPEYLQCAICEEVVKDAMILPWDDEGRTTCDECIRDALAQNGFRCPLTGQEGVSPDDLLPNMALRKAADTFVKGVMAKMDEIDKQQVEDDEASVEEETANVAADTEDKGVLLSKKAEAKKKDKDPFGGDEFGGDVFAVEKKEAEEEEEKQNGEEEKEKPKVEEKPKEIAPTEQKDESKTEAETKQAKETPKISPAKEERKRHRGPPMGYQMGPAGMPGPVVESPLVEPPHKRLRSGSDAGSHASSFDDRRRFDDRGGRGFNDHGGRGFDGRSGRGFDDRGGPPGRGGFDGRFDDRGRGGRFGGRGPPPPGRGFRGRGFRGRGRY